MLPLLLVPALLQMGAMFLDEFVFHRKRGLPKWERLGHPLDTLTAIACYAWLVLMPPTSPHALAVYVALCLFSCLFITKDEFVHAQVCEPTEMWLHAVLFVLHPIVFLAFGFIWYLRLAPWVVKAELLLTVGLLVHQLVYWSSIARQSRANSPGK
ncbi:MAG: hypothetical protein ABI548_15310 [Polyangiaceae bacterium]